MNVSSRTRLQRGGVQQHRDAEAHQQAEHHRGRGQPDQRVEEHVAEVRPAAGSRGSWRGRPKLPPFFMPSSDRSVKLIHRLSTIGIAVEQHQQDHRPRAQHQRQDESSRTLRRLAYRWPDRRQAARALPPRSALLHHRFVESPAAAPWRPRPSMRWPDSAVPNARPVTFHIAPIGIGPGGIGTPGAGELQLLGKALQLGPKSTFLSRDCCAGNCVR